MPEASQGAYKNVYVISKNRKSFWIFSRMRRLKERQRNGGHVAFGNCILLSSQAAIITRLVENNRWKKTGWSELNSGSATRKDDRHRFCRSRFKTCRAGAPLTPTLSQRVRVRSATRKVNRFSGRINRVALPASLSARGKSRSLPRLPAPARSWRPAFSDARSRLPPVLPERKRRL